MKNKIVNSIGFSELKYDDTVLTLDQITINEEILSKCILSEIDTDVNVVLLGLKNPEEFCGKVVTLEFTVDADAADGTVEVSYTPLIKLDSDEIETSWEKAIVSIKKRKLGDINGDNNVNIQDAIKLFQHSMFPKIYPIDYGYKIDYISTTWARYSSRK